MANLYLAHHGILGQKWGIRRYQNKDGSLTAAGKKRYSNLNNKFERDAKSALNLYTSARESAQALRNFPKVFGDENKQELTAIGIANTIHNADIKLSQCIKYYDQLAKDFGGPENMETYLKARLEHTMVLTYADLSDSYKNAGAFYTGQKYRIMSNPEIELKSEKRKLEKIREDRKELESSYRYFQSVQDAAINKEEMSKIFFELNDLSKQERAAEQRIRDLAVQADNNVLSKKR